MITLTILSIIVYLLVIIRIRSKCKLQGIDFNPLEGSLIEWTIFILGTTFSLVGFLCLCSLITKYLP